MVNLIIPDKWQQDAVNLLRDGKDVVVQAPTGAGKTYIFELIYESLRGQSVYTVPTRALANDKLAEWKARGWDVGISTGDLAENLGARVVVATLETQKGRFLRREGPRLLVIDEYQLLPNAYTEGFLLGQVKAQKRSGFLAGSYSVSGWWYFFPLAFLIKTPISLILLLFAGLALCADRWRRFLDHGIYALLPLLTFLTTAMLMKLNIGVRHILPIQPFVLLLAGTAIAELYTHRLKPVRLLLGAACLMAVAEFALICPHYLAFFNQFIGGLRNGQKYLVDSNLDWGQDLKGLKAWMDGHGVGHINLSYFGTADPAYYKIDCTYLPGGPFFADPLVKSADLPGYVAVSVTNLRGVYFTESTRQIYQKLLSTEPVAIIGYSIYIYRVQDPGGPRL